MRYIPWLIVGLVVMLAAIDSVYENTWAPLPVVIAIGAFALAIARAWQHRATDVLRIDIHSSALTLQPAAAGRVELSDVWLETCIHNTSREEIEIQRVVIELPLRLTEALGRRRALRVLPEHQGNAELELPFSVAAESRTVLFLTAQFDASSIDERCQCGAITHWKSTEVIWLLVSYTHRTAHKAIRRQLKISTKGFKERYSIV